MRNFELAPEEKVELRVAHKSAKKRCAADAYKINAIILLGDGWSLEEVSDALLMDEEALRKYVNDYKTGGISKLLQTNYKGSASFLTKTQIEELQQELDTNIYLTTKSIIDSVQKKFNASYSISGMTALLHKLGYVYKKPKLVPKAANEEMQEEFIEFYKEFMRTKSPKEAVFFVDAVHPEYNSMVAYGWLKKGHIRPLVSKSNNRRVNLHGAINPETLDTFVMEGGKVDSDSTICLFQTLEKNYPLAKSITVILDNAPYHKSAEVREYLMNSKIKTVYLPSGCPNLNLIERLWKFFKKTVLYNKCFVNFDIFRSSCLGFFDRSMPQHSDSLWRIMTDEFEIIPTVQT